MEVLSKNYVTQKKIAPGFYKWQFFTPFSVPKYSFICLVSSVPPPPFHENSFSGKNDPSAIQHGPAIGESFTYDSLI